MTTIASANDPLVALDEHWAVSTFSAEQRSVLVGFADEWLRALRGGGTTAKARPATEDLLALASAYDIAARERLELEGLGSPFALARPNELTDRFRRRGRRALPRSARRRARPRRRSE